MDEAAPLKVPAGRRVGQGSTPSDREPRVSVILPVFNAAADVGCTINQIIAFAKAHEEYSFIFVDDGSSDATPDLIAALIDVGSADAPSLRSRLRLIRSRVNTGKGYAVLLGVNSVVGDDDDLVLFTDGDLAYSLDHLPRLVEALRTADVAIGSRRAPEGGYRATPVRTVMGWTYNRIARFCLGAPYRDTQAGLKGFRLGTARRIFGSMRVTGFSFDVEILYLAQRFGYRIAEIPATVSTSHKRRGSSVSLWREPRRMFMGMVGILLSGRLGQYERRRHGRWPMALVSFDAEEFDLPVEYGTLIPREQQFSVAREGLRRVLDMLQDVPARATIFMTAAFAESCPDLVRECVEQEHEIASHSVHHSRSADDDLATSKRRIEAVAGVPVRGFRRPRMAPTSARDLADAGYTYDSSVHPTWIPGRYNGLRTPRKAFAERAVVRIPPSTTPLLRFPLFWLAFKNLPSWAYRAATRWTLNTDGYVALYFHPWELCDLTPYNLPRHIRRIDGRQMTDRLTRYLRWLSRRADFATYSQAEERFRAGAWPFAGVTDSYARSGDRARPLMPGADVRVVVPAADAPAGLAEPSLQHL